MSYFKFEIPLTEIAKLEAALQGLDARMANKVLRKGLAKAAQALKASMKKNSPKNTGELKKSFIYRIRKTGNKDYVAKVGAGGKRGPVVHLLEGGTKPHDIYQKTFNRTLHHPGAKPSPFFQDAVKQAQKDAQEAFVKAVKEATEQ